MSPYCHQMGLTEPSEDVEVAAGVETAAPDTGTPTPSPTPSVTPSPPPAPEGQQEENLAMNPDPFYHEGLPDCLPIDHNLPHLLRHVAGSAELVSVRDIKLRVISREMSLQRLAFFLPSLRELSLDGSCLNSLRDLGCGLTSLQVLRVSRCGLDSLDGLFGLTSLRELHASHNQVDDVDSCSSLPHIRLVDLRKNSVSDVGFLEFLNICTHLEHLTLAECPAASKPGYRPSVRRFLPQLITLDGVPIAQEQDENNENDDGDDDDTDGPRLEEGRPNQGAFKPTFRGDAPWQGHPQNPRHPRVGRGQGDVNRDQYDATTVPSSIAHQNSSEHDGAPPQNKQKTTGRSVTKRPSTAVGLANTPLRDQQGADWKPRPSSAKTVADEGEGSSSSVGDSPSALTSGMVVCGNLTMALRSRRKRQDAWLEEQPSPSRLLTEVGASQDESEAPGDGSGEGADVLEESRKWREHYATYRSDNRLRWEEEEEEEGQCGGEAVKRIRATCCPHLFAPDT